MFGNFVTFLYFLGFAKHCNYGFTSGAPSRRWLGVEAGASAQRSGRTTRTNATDIAAVGSFDRGHYFC